MGQLLLICAGGAFGTGALYLLSVWMLEKLGPSFPFGTLTVNTIGSFLLAFIMYANVEAAAISPAARLVLGTGVMGGFTTYSTFSYETMMYLQGESWGIAAAYIAATVAGCLASCLAGWAAGRWILGT